MTIEQLTGRYLRLKQELELAYRQMPWQAAHIDRLASDLAATEQELSRAHVTLPQKGSAPESAAA